MKKLNFLPISILILSQMMFLQFLNAQQGFDISGFQNKSQFSKSQLTNLPADKQLDSIVESSELLNPGTNPGQNQSSSSKQEFTYYNTSGLLATESYFSRNFTDEPWLPDFKTEYVYDNEGEIIKKIFYHYDHTALDWKASSKIESYSSNDTVYSESYDWKNETWVKTGKGSLFFPGDGTSFSINLDWNEDSESYDSGNKQNKYAEEDGTIMDEKFEWNNNTLSWDLKSRTRNKPTFSNDTLKEKLISNWDIVSEAWIDSLKNEFIFSTPDSDLFISYKWNASTDQWDKATKNYHIYENDFPIVSENYRWDPENSEWNQFLMRNYIFDENGKLLDDKMILHEQKQGWWHHYEYSAQGDPVSYTQSLIDPSDLTTWIEYKTETRTFDLNFEVDQVMSIRNLQDADHMIIRRDYIQQADNFDENLVKSGKIQYYYSSPLTSEDKISKTDDNFMVYPNPCSDQFTIKFSSKNNLATIRIFDMNGRMVLEHLATNNSNVSIRNLKAGVYSCTIDTRDGAINKKKILIVR